MGRRLTHAVASTTCSRFHNPEKYRIVLFDQRGCGKSTPHACLEENTTWDLIKDMEQLRVHLGIDKWQVFGGSWGSTLGLAYAVTHPDRVTELVLRGIFTLRKKELDFFYQEGASFMYPDAWDQYLDHIPEDEVRACCPSLTQTTAACRFPHCVDLFQRDNLMAAYHKRLTSDDPETRQAAAKCWSIWEGSTSKLVADPSYSKKYAGDEFALAFARIECHYFMNGMAPWCNGRGSVYVAHQHAVPTPGGFFEHDGWLLDNVDKIRHIPGYIVQVGAVQLVGVCGADSNSLGAPRQGRYDMVCPMYTAWELHKRWPEAEFDVKPTAGHSCMGECGKLGCRLVPSSHMLLCPEKPILDGLVRATDRFAEASTE